ncbi:MAG: hypothetical protein COA78_06080 [Blastopirellula sp.]|nr:MAG: hypothetical protein COA78_06080 [Blastopirellula sp.]
MNYRVLIIAYQFPPVGGAGVQRISKFVKYLPKHGWDVSVLTVENPSVPTVDQSLLQDVPSGTIIRKAKSLEPGYGIKDFISGSRSTPKPWYSLSKILSIAKDTIRSAALNILQPDPQILWVLNAILKGKKLLKDHNHQVILVSGPPFSSFFVGSWLKRISGVPLVLDYRDEWSLSNQYWKNKSNNCWTRFCQGFMQRAVIKSADTITATTESTANELKKQSLALGRSIDTHCIYNGYDHEDFKGVSFNRSVSDRLKLTYLGTLWRLTSPRPLVKALLLLNLLYPEILKKLDIEFVGRMTSDEFHLINKLRNLPCQVKCKEYVDHSESISLMHQSDILCLFLDSLPGAERVIPAKIFEYLASNQRILAITPESELTQILHKHDDVSCFHPQEIPQIANYLFNSLTNPSLLTKTKPTRDVSQFRRDNLSKQLAKVLCSTYLRSNSTISDTARLNHQLSVSSRSPLC